MEIHWFLEKGHAMCYCIPIVQAKSIVSDKENTWRHGWNLFLWFLGCLFDGVEDWSIFTKTSVNETKYLLSKHYLLCGNINLFLKGILSSHFAGKTYSFFHIRRGRQFYQWLHRTACLNQLLLTKSVAITSLKRNLIDWRSKQIQLVFHNF